MTDDPQPWTPGDDPTPGDRRHAPATLRNREPILAGLRDVLPVRGTVLEIASGSGEHGVYFAAELPGVIWQPSDADPDALGSIEAWIAEAGADNIAAPLHIDASSENWPIDSADALVCINMIHIAPWAAARGLFAGAARVLPPGAPLCLYGPFRQVDVPTAESNEAFDRSLRARNPEWGLRDLEKVSAEAEARGFALEAIKRMPANNLLVVYRRMPLARR